MVLDGSIPKLYPAPQILDRDAHKSQTKFSTESYEIFVLDLEVVSQLQLTFVKLRSSGLLSKLCTTSHNPNKMADITKNNNEDKCV